MAEQRSDQRSDGRGSRGARSGLSGREAIQRVKEELPELLGRPIESVLGVERSDENGWRLTVQVVELSRTPHSTDVLGVYWVTVDQDGELQSYRRQRRYYRNQAEED